jgi:hypothetical protein
MKQEPQAQTAPKQASAAALLARPAALTEQLDTALDTQKVQVTPNSSRKGIVMLERLGRHRPPVCMSLTAPQARRLASALISAAHAAGDRLDEGSAA